MVYTSARLLFLFAISRERLVDGSPAPHFLHQYSHGGDDGAAAALQTVSVSHVNRPLLGVGSASMLQESVGGSAEPASRMVHVDVPMFGFGSLPPLLSDAELGFAHGLA